LAPVLRLALRWFLVLALLAGWQAALQHPIVHVDSLGGFVHLHDGDSKSPNSGPLCDALAALTACAPHGISPALAAEHPGHPFQSPEARAPRIAEAPPFLSQGPPASV
jgi:hypothetical protein